MIRISITAAAFVRVRSDVRRGFLCNPQLPQADAMKAICDRAQVGLIKARAKIVDL